MATSNSLEVPQGPCISKGLLSLGKLGSAGGCMLSGIPSENFNASLWLAEDPLCRNLGLLTGQGIYPFQLRRIKAHVLHSWAHSLLNVRTDKIGIGPKSKEPSLDQTVFPQSNFGAGSLEEKISSKWPNPASTRGPWIWIWTGTTPMTLTMSLTLPSLGFTSHPDIATSRLTTMCW
jgi:hypothetical protein